LNNSRFICGRINYW